MKTIFASALCAGLAAAATGMTNQTFVEETGPVKDTYMAVYKNHDGDCLTLKMRVEKAKADADGMQRTIAEGPARNAIIGKTCYVTFKGSDAARKAVADMPEKPVVSQVNTFQIQQSAIWNVDRIDQADLPLSGTQLNTALGGEGAEVYVIDTGINADHVEFEGRASQSPSFVQEQLPDRQGHGTHCAGTVGGKTYGVARKASIIGVKVFDSRGTTTTEAIVQGLEWATAQAGNKAAVVSMSLGGPVDEALDAAVMDVYNAGHLVVVAAGNSNKDACSTSPARLGNNGNIITVGATQANDRRSGFSNYGSCVDLYAPGSAITSADFRSNTGTRVLSGTSMATPLVAGVAATLVADFRASSSSSVRDDARLSLLRLAVEGRVSDPRSGTPNKLLQVPLQSLGGEVPGGPVGSPVPSPTPSPPPTCSWCWWLRDSAALSPSAQAPQDVAAPADNSAVILAAVISGGSVAFIALVVGVVLRKRQSPAATKPEVASVVSPEGML